jgi:cytochrome c oxidase accessory protein FixG
MPNPNIEKTSSKFRDQLATIDDTGKRLWVYAKMPKGKITNYRNLIGYTLLILLFVVPFMRINGEPILLLDFLDRKIVIFGMRFWPQDFHLMFLAMVALFVFIILFTVTYGRLWCGWTCPQTIFLELVFRKIEFLIDGNARNKKIMDEAPWTYGKIWRRVLKHSIFFLVSVILILTLSTYFIGTEKLFGILANVPIKQAGAFIAFFTLSGLFYFVFSWFREQVCTIVCPYGRLQGVLLDRSSIVVAYDYKRGDPKATFRMGENRKKAGKGNCINCTQCVQVCPTGIDIRNGTQMECINCGACIDACNGMMNKVGLPSGLIRYTSEKTLAEGKKQKFSVRTIAYSFVLVLLLGIIAYSFSIRSDIEATILRAPGMLYQPQSDGRFSNLYNIKLVNKTNEDMPVEIRLLSHEGEINIIGSEIMVSTQNIGESVFFTILNADDLTKEKIPLVFGIYSNGELIETIESTFIGPEK